MDDDGNAAQIDLWCVFYREIKSDALLARYRALLTGNERRQVTRFYFHDDRVRYLVTRALVRTTLSKYWPIEPNSWSFVRNFYGRPEIAITSETAIAADMSFNISHTSGLIMMGVTLNGTIGVDVENIEQRKAPLAVAERYFSPSEREALKRTPVASQSERFFEYWTLKEAYVKAMGKGFFISPNEFSCVLHTNSASVSCETAQCEDPAAWRLWQICPAIGYLGAICVRSPCGINYSLIARQTIPLISDKDLAIKVLRAPGQELAQDRW
jgi:4'-phosphopantetheinyl transferase